MTVNFPTNIKIPALYGEVKEYFSFTNSDNSTIYVVEMQFIQLLSTALHFKYSIVYPEDSQTAFRLDNGRWTGIIGMLKEQKADMVAISEERSQVVDFSYPYYIRDITFLTHPLQPLAKSFTVLYPFSYQLWITPAVSLFSMSIIFYALKSGRENYSLCLLMVLGSVVGETLTFSSSAVKRWLIISVWLIGIMFIKYSYEATLLSFLSCPPMSGIRNIDELARGVEGDSYQCITFKGSYIIRELLESEDLNYRIIGKSLQKTFKGDMVYNMEILSKVWKSAFVTTGQILSTVGDAYYVSQDSLSIIMFGIAVKKNLCCKRTLDKVVRKIFEAGLYEKMLKDRVTISFTKKSSKQNKQPEKHRIITLDDTIGAFFIIIIEQALAIVVFFIECIWKK